MKRYIKISLLMTSSLVISLGLIFVNISFATDEVIEKVGSGYINWSSNIIRVTGSGAPDPEASNLAQARLGAERVAKMDAYRNLLEIAEDKSLALHQTLCDVARTQTHRRRLHPPP